MTFKLRFPEKDVREWAGRYEYKNEKDDDLSGGIARRAREHGHLTKRDFLRICRWKARGRTTWRCEKNTEKFVKEVTSTSFSTPLEKLRIEILTLLDGVNWPTASTILHFCAKGRYPILDYRALWSTGKSVPKKYDFDFWWEYTMFCRQIAKRCGVSMRTLDRALWQYSKERQR